MHLMEADKELNPAGAAAVEKLIIGKVRLSHLACAVLLD